MRNLTNTSLLKSLLQPMTRRAKLFTGLAVVSLVCVGYWTVRAEMSRRIITEESSLRAHGRDGRLDSILLLAQRPSGGSRAAVDVLAGRMRSTPGGGLP
jgi:hypothetical protein